MSKTLACLLTFLFSFSVTSYAQPATGIYAHGSFDVKGFDTINEGNGNVHFTIPIFNKAGRGGMTFAYNLTYNGLIYTPVSAGSTSAWVPAPTFGWQSDDSVPIGGTLRYTSSGYPCGYLDSGYNYYQEWQQYDTNFVFYDSDGAVHSIGGYIGGCPDGPTGPSDGPPLSSQAVSINGYTVVYSPTQNGIYEVVMPNGQTVSYPIDHNNNPYATVGSRWDSNGNQISWSAGTFTDTTGSQVLSIADGVYTYPTVQGTAPNFTSGHGSTTVTYASYTVQTAFGTSSAEYGPLSTSLVDRVTMADGSYYAFTYEPTPGHAGAVTGRITSITLPAGGTIQYSYGSMLANGSPSSISRTTSDTPTTPTGYYFSAPNGNGISTTQLASPDGNWTNLQFITVASGESFEVSRKVFQGASGASTPLLSSSALYNGSTVSDPTTQPIPSEPLSEINIFVTMDGIATKGSDILYDPYGNPSAINQYDFGTTGRGALLQSDQYSYTSPSLYATVVPTYHRILDGSGNQIAYTQYGYDESALQTTQGLPNHLTVFNTYRGNLTTVTRTGTPSPNEITTLQYDDAGNPVSSTSTANGSSWTTTYGYDATRTFVTSTTLPTPSSGVAMSTSQSTDLASGILFSSTNVNAQTTTYSSFDTLGRVLTTTNPSGGGALQATYVPYVGTPPIGLSPNSTVVSQTMNSSQSEVSQSLYDAFGRPVRAAVANGQGSNPWYQQDTCLDSHGRVAYSSVPYQGPGFSSAIQCSGSGVSYAYDGLNRPLTKVTVDGTTHYQYLGGAKKVTDVNGLSKITQTDGIGRLKAVCEVNSATLAGSTGTPSACGLSFPATGFLTTYSYQPANGTTVVLQGLQQRTFVSDELGRPTQLVEPEAGTTTYAYTYNSTGEVVTRTKPQANVVVTPGTAPTTTTTYQYDSLSRLLSVNYSDGTLSKSYSYDQATVGGSLSTGYSKGNLTAIEAGTGTSQWNLSWFVYDQMGRVTETLQCFPGRCGNSAFDVLRFYTYDLAGNRTNEAYLQSASSGTWIGTAYVPSIAGEESAIYTNLSGSSYNNGTLIPWVQNSPFGPTTYNLGNGLTGQRIQDASGRTRENDICNVTQYPCGAGLLLQTQTWGGVSGNQVTKLNDLTSSSGAGQFGYDAFNRISGSTYANRQFSYTYDRYGNRWSQTPISGSGPNPQVSFNETNNQLVGGYSYDGAGNLLSDGVHSYTYDADGNVLAVDGGQTASYVYDVFNHRVVTNVGGTLRDIGYNIFGQRVSVWDGSANSPTLLASNIYWNGAPFAVTTNGQIYYQHQDLAGSQAAITASNGTVAGTASSMPFGDGFTPTGVDPDASHFGGLDHDYESLTEHAQFRQYSSRLGLWMSPDPYDGSYDPTNPQSFNRYAYVLNNPLGYVDPIGLNYTSVGADGCVNFTNSGSVVIIGTDSAGNPIYGIEVDSLTSCPTGQMPYPVNVSSMPPSGGGGGGGQSNAPNNGPTWSQKNKACLDKINSTPDGKFYNFFSPLSMIPGIGPEWKGSIAEDVGGGLAKFAIFKGMSSASQNWAGTALGVMGGEIANGIHVVAEEVLAPVSAAAMAGQLTVHAGCAIGANF